MAGTTYTAATGHLLRGVVGVERLAVPPDGSRPWTIFTWHADAVLFA